MSEPPRDVAPRRHALRPDERRHVVEHENGAARAAIVAQELRRGRGEVHLAPVAQQRHFLHRRHRTAATRLCQERLERTKILALPELLGAHADDRPVHFQQAKRRAVDRLDVPGRTKGHDAGGDPLEHRLDVLAALVELLILALEIEP